MFVKSAVFIFLLSLIYRPLLSLLFYLTCYTIPYIYLTSLYLLLSCYLYSNSISFSSFPYEQHSIPIPNFFCYVSFYFVSCAYAILLSFSLIISDNFLFLTTLKFLNVLPQGFEIPLNMSMKPET